MTNGTAERPATTDWDNRPYDSLYLVVSNDPAGDLYYFEGHDRPDCPYRTGAPVDPHIAQATAFPVWPCKCVPVGGLKPHEAPTAREVLDNTPQAPARGTGPARERFSDNEALEYARRYALNLGRKFEIADVDETLAQAAQVFLASYDGSFEFLVELQGQRRSLSVGQAKGVLNCLRADILRQQATAERTETIARPEPAAEGTAVPDGTYTVVFEDGSRRTLRVRTQDEDKDFAPGQQIISFLNGPDNWSNYKGFGFITDGRLRVWKKFSDDSTLVEAARVLVSDPRAAAKAYGIESGNCGLCGRKLTVPESIESGLGPVCANKAGW